MHADDIIFRGKSVVITLSSVFDRKDELPSRSNRDFDSERKKATSNTTKRFARHSNDSTIPPLLSQQNMIFGVRVAL